MDVGVIGTGAMGRNHVRVYSELKGVDEVYVYDIDHAAAAEISRMNDAHVAASLDEMLGNVEAVSCCVPTSYHFETATSVIERGVSVLIEKPVCSSAGEAAKLIDQIPDDIVVGVGHIERFNPIVDELKRIIKDPLYIEFKRHNPGSSRITDVSVVEDLMIHDIDILFNSLYPDCTEYKLKSSSREGICAALFELEGTPVFISASNRSSKKIRNVYIEEDDLTISGDFMNQELFVYRKPDQYSLENERYVQENVVEKVLVNKIEPLKRELSEFVSCVRTGKRFSITPEQGRRNLEICEQVVRS